MSWEFNVIETNQTETTVIYTIDTSEPVSAEQFLQNEQIQRLYQDRSYGLESKHDSALTWFLTIYKQEQNGQHI